MTLWEGVASLPSFTRRAGEGSGMIDPVTLSADAATHFKWPLEAETTIGPPIIRTASFSPSQNDTEVVLLAQPGTARGQRLKAKTSR